MARVRWTAGTAIAESNTGARWVAGLAALTAAGIGIFSDVHVATAATLLALIPATLVDVLDRRLPDRLVAGAAGVCLAFCAIGATFEQRIDIVGAILGIAALAGPLLVLHLASPRSMGFGDVKAGAVIGMALGLTAPVLGLVALCLGSAASAAIALGRRHRSIAFGPGLLGGALVALVLFVSPANGVAAADGLTLTPPASGKDVSQ